ncbi:PREDICTED: NFX1-type zinc finger-containing protein 1 [Nicrophorus vespilloides]|uniref:NFX1-type zinc finger-containing protein 1 n=1 Tax=Nicrophorus vespilloides TaxID=110193 RepID=A0ABM1MKS0_NICVS|nr:PREDICTED: NFX1-type zinc finger-containing protein 1 [Nicrophorus vespilloides]XP_017775170.1 PREDICTED: NFX1-type zinc finger-containing protein 1 [Nicrophorus vespilloides]
MDWFTQKPSSDVNSNIEKPENCFTLHNDRTRSPDSTKEKKMGFKQLEIISKKSAEDVILDLSNERAALKSCMESQLTPEFIVIIVNTFATISESKFSEKKLSLYTLFINEIFICSLESFLNKSYLCYNQESKYSKVFKDKPEEFWKNLLVCVNNVIDYFPNHSQRIVPSLIDGIEGSKSVSKISDADIEALRLKLDSLKDLLLFNDSVESPNSILEIGIYPTSDELLSDYIPFIRENIIKGSYNDVNHYIDVQFRLMREDFVNPIRMGICDYDYNGSSHIDVFREVKFLHKEASRALLGYLVHVPKRRGNDKLKYGSLVGFTSTSLDKLFFGKVIDTKLQYKHFTEVVVLFEEELNIDFEGIYTMVLSHAYFEPYYHVLKTLKAFKLTEFPLKKYLVDVNFTQEYPDYLKPSTIYNIAGKRVTICNKDWPMIETELDDTQLKAFKYALTNKFSVIQGPPGTGKTFVGLKIIQTLIQNRDNWKSSGPILVVSYTNQALDQFLEGILEFTDQILRIGEQSKSDKLIDYNMKQLKRKYNVDYKKRKQIDRVNEIRDELNMLYSTKYMISKGTCIVRFSCFEQFHSRFKHSWFRNAEDEDDIIDWLMGDIESMYGEIIWNESVIDDVLQQFEPSNRAYNPQESDDELKYADDFAPGKKNMYNEQNPNVVSLQDICLKIRSLNDMIGNQHKFTKDCEKLYSSLKTYKCLLFLLNSLPSIKANPEMRYFDLDRAFVMTGKQRWQLYNYWVKKYEECLDEQIHLLEADFAVWAREYDDFSEIIDTSVMKQKLVIGMTTTAAARRQKTLEILQCPIVVVEEAAEVLEAHIISALSSNCQHLILLGDHKQLKPSTADYKIDKDFKLGVSLFERMIKNNVPFQCMNVQYRMRPEIASLICPLIYPDLQNSAKVERYPEVVGVAKSVFFLSHNHLERKSIDSSKENPYEASFLIAFARYLVANGYLAKDITILSTYQKQMQVIGNEKRKYVEIKDTRITCLDNFQGEENQIILLSLVRNNQEGNIGFLNQENRICVAMSRAKQGLYIMGNMKLLSDKSPLWRKIHSTLSQMRAVGTDLELICKKHGNRKKVKYVVDIQQRIKGCEERCHEVMSCGHSCDKLCHYGPHDKKCNKMCSK